MKCPQCKGEEGRVLQTRTSDDDVLRRRECTACGRRFTTRETYADLISDMAQIVMKLRDRGFTTEACAEILGCDIATIYSYIGMKAYASRAKRRYEKEPTQGDATSSLSGILG